MRLKIELPHDLVSHAGWHFTEFGDNCEKSFEQSGFLAGFPEGGDFPIGHVSIQGAKDYPGPLVTCTGRRNKSHAETGCHERDGRLLGIHFLNNIGHEAYLVKGTHEGAIQRGLGKTLVERSEERRVGKEC